MEENNKKEKKVLKLKLKTFADLKRFTSKQLQKIVEKFRTKNKDMMNLSIEELMKTKKSSKIIKAIVRQSLINRADRNTQKNLKKIEEGRNDYINDVKQYKQDIKDGKYTEKEKNKLNKEFENRAYKMNKVMYTKNLGPENQEKPKNPKIQRAIKNVGKVTKKVGKMAKTVGKGVAVVAAAPFVLGYKVATGIGRGVKAIGRGGKVAALTAGKVAGRVAGNVKDEVQTARKEVHKEIKKQDLMKDMKKLNRTIEEKNAREEARRKSLHMDAEQQQIDHEQAMKKMGENANEQQLEEEK